MRRCGSDSGSSGRATTSGPTAIGSTPTIARAMASPRASSTITASTGCSGLAIRQARRHVASLADPVGWSPRRGRRAHTRRLRRARPGWGSRARRVPARAPRPRLPARSLELPFRECGAGRDPLVHVQILAINDFHGHLQPLEGTTASSSSRPTIRWHLPRTRAPRTRASPWSPPEEPRTWRLTSRACGRQPQYPRRLGRGPHRGQPARLEPLPGRALGPRDEPAGPGSGGGGQSRLRSRPARALAAAAPGLLPRRLRRRQLRRRIVSVPRRERHRRLDRPHLLPPSPSATSGGRASPSSARRSRRRGASPRRKRCRASRSPTKRPRRTPWSPSCRGKGSPPSCSSCIRGDAVARRRLRRMPGLLGRHRPHPRQAEPGHRGGPERAHPPGVRLRDGGRLVTSAASYGRLLTKVDLTIDPSAHRVVEKHARNVPITRDVTPDAEVARSVQAYADRASGITGRVVGYVKSTLTGNSTGGAQPVLRDAAG